MLTLETLEVVRDLKVFDCWLMGFCDATKLGAIVLEEFLDEFSVAYLNIH